MVSNEKNQSSSDEENTIATKIYKKRHLDHGTELQLYLSLPILGREIKPLKWWKMNESQYPTLARMARDYLAIPATSVPSEQCFSASKNLVTINRNRLKGKTIRACMCLNSWWADILADSNN